MSDEDLKMRKLLICAVISMFCMAQTCAPSPPGDGGGDTTGSEDDPSGVTQPVTGDYGFYFRIDPVAIAADGAADARIQVSARKWETGQDPQTDEPAGDYVEGVPVEISTSMGHFTVNNEPKYEQTTSSEGQIIVALVGQIPGMATITAKAMDGSGVAATARVPIVRVELAPSEVSISLNEHISFECRVLGPDDPDQLYYMWRGQGGYMQPQGSEEFYGVQTPMPWVKIFQTPILEWFRWSGKPKEGYLEVEAFMIVEGQDDISLGTARTPIHISEYKVSCTLGGRVTRGDDSGCHTRYGYLIPKVKEATGYGVRGTNFNDPLYYGDSYSHGIILNRGGYTEEDGGYFVGLTSGGTTGLCTETDTELIESFAWRFEGGIFESWPLFGSAGLY